LPALLAGGGLFVAPGNVAVLAAAMKQMATDEPARAVMAARARERAGLLDWQRSAAATMGALREAAGPRLRPVSAAAPLTEHAGAVG
jgi:glycosyltransferase involved in cell wall biosynthesis